MNIDVSEIIKSKSTLLIVIGAAFIMIAALSGVPTGSQTILNIDIGWRYVIAAVGTILLLLGLFLAIKESNSQTQTSRASKNFEEFKNDKEYTIYLLKRLREAKESVSDLTYENYSRDSGKAILFFNSTERDEYLHIVEEISKRVKYREIMMFEGKGRRIEKAERLMSYAGKYYQLAGYADLPNDAPPRHNFIIIDNEVIIKGMVIRQQELVDYYQSFYDELWASATPIKVSVEENLALIKIAKQKQKNYQQ